MSDNGTITDPVVAAGNTIKLRQSPSLPSGEEERLGLDRMAVRADQMEKICRRLITEAQISYVRDSSEIEDRYRDERAKLEAFHVKRMADLNHSLKRIEALRQA